MAHLKKKKEEPLANYFSFFLVLGIAVDKNGLMFFVDATMIRKVDQNGIISTLLGANDLTAVRPLSCDASMDVSQVQKRTYACIVRKSHKSLKEKFSCYSFE